MIIAGKGVFEQEIENPAHLFDNGSGGQMIYFQL